MNDRGQQFAPGAQVPPPRSSPPPSPPPSSGRRPSAEVNANLDQLRKAVDLLQSAYDQAYAELESASIDPLQGRTYDGRYILLDALVALVQARTALAQDQVPQFAVEEALVIQSGDSLLLRVDRHLSMAEMEKYSDAIGTQLKERLGLKDVVLLGGIDGWAVKR